MKVEKTISPSGYISYLVVNENDYSIVEEILFFIKHLEHKNVSINTISKYCFNLKEFFEWLKVESLNFYEVKPKSIVNFIDFLDSKGELSPNTINNYLSTLSSFYQFYEVMGGFLIKNPIAKTKNTSSSFIVKKVFKHQVETSYFKRKIHDNHKTKRLFPKDIKILYDSISTLHEEDSLNKRNQVIFKLLYETGIRLGECLNLRIIDYSEPNPSEEFGEIFVIKRNKTYHPDHQVKTNSRAIPVSMELIFDIDDYVCNFRPNTKIDSLFVNHGNRNNGNFMIRNTITQLFLDISNSTDIKCTAHMLRHTHATELSEFGYDQIYISNRLGHNSIESTNKYVHLSIESQTDAYSRFMESRKDLF